MFLISGDAIVLKTVVLCVEIPSDLNYNFGFLLEDMVSKISMSRPAWKKLYTDSGVDNTVISTKLKLEPIESIRSVQDRYQIW